MQNVITSVADESLLVKELRLVVVVVVVVVVFSDDFINTTEEVVANVERVANLLCNLRHADVELGMVRVTNLEKELSCPKWKRRGITQAPGLEPLGQSNIKRHYVVENHRAHWCTGIEEKCNLRLFLCYLFLAPFFFQKSHRFSA